MRTMSAIALLCLCASGCGTPTQPGGCSYSVTPLVFAPCMPRWQGTATTVTDDGCSWTVTPTASWIVIDGQSGGTGSGTFAFTVAENYAAPRQGAIEVRWPNATGGYTIWIAQAGCLYAFEPPSSPVMPAAGGDGSFMVITMPLPNECGGATQNACVWTAQPDSPWITIVSGSSGGDGDSVRFRVAPNDGSSARTGRIVVRDRQFQVTQAGR